MLFSQDVYKVFIAFFSALISDIFNRFLMIFLLWPVSHIKYVLNVGVLLEFVRILVNLVCTVNFHASHFIQSGSTLIYYVLFVWKFLKSFTFVDCVYLIARTLLSKSVSRFLQFSDKSPDLIRRVLIQKFYVPVLVQECLVVPFVRLNLTQRHLCNFLPLTFLFLSLTLFMHRFESLLLIFQRYYFVGPEAALFGCKFWQRRLHRFLFVIANNERILISSLLPLPRLLNYLFRNRIAPF